MPFSQGRWAQSRVGTATAIPTTRTVHTSGRLSFHAASLSYGSPPAKIPLNSLLRNQSRHSYTHQPSSTSALGHSDENSKRFTSKPLNVAQSSVSIKNTYGIQRSAKRRRVGLSAVTRNMSSRKFTPPPPPIPLPLSRPPIFGTPASRWHKSPTSVPRTVHGSPLSRITNTHLSSGGSPIVSSTHHNVWHS